MLGGKRIIGVSYLVANHVYELTYDRSFNNTMVITPEDLVENYDLVMQACVNDILYSLPTKDFVLKQIYQRKRIKTAKDYYKWAFNK